MMTVLSSSVPLILSSIATVSRVSVGAAVSPMNVRLLLAWLALPASSVNLLLLTLTLLTVEPGMRVKSTVKLWSLLPTVRLLSSPPITVRSLISKPLGASLKLNVRVAFSLTRASSLLISTLGVSVSPMSVKLLLALPLLPASSL